MTGDLGLESLLRDRVTEILERVSDAVLVLDHERMLRFANQRARLLLGFGDGDEVGGRCRLTTRGVDCESSCPLTFALAGGRGPLHGFRTVYQTRDGQPVPLVVTVLPFFAADGEFAGAVEILRPTLPDPGVVAVGRSPAALELRRAMTQAAHAATPVAVVGDSWAAADVAAAIHRFAGLPNDLFVVWRGSWVGVNPWPAGSLLVTAAADWKSARSSLPPGWRLIMAAASEGELAALAAGEVAVVRVPPVADLAADLPFIVRAQLAALSPALQVSADAVAVFVEIARGRGFAALAAAAAAAVSRANGQLDRSHLVEEGGVILVDAVLAQSNPLTAVEERLLREVLERCEWRMQEAADRLGISRVTLWRKLKDHGIERPGNGTGA